MSAEENKAEAFVQKVLGDTRGLAVTIMAALGDRVGLFKDLAAHGPATSDELAARTGVNERYAREWLGGMMSAGYLTYDPASRRFTLPPEHIPVLAQEGGAFFFGGTHQMLLALIGTLNLLEKAFREGGGIPMSAYDENAWDGLERDMAGVYNTDLAQNWIPAMPAVKAMLERGVRVADVGCGRGLALIRLAQAFPNSRYVGYDVFKPNAGRAAANAAAAGVGERVHFQTLDAASGLPEPYDLITTFDVIHDSANPLQLLRAIRQGLTAEGRYVCMEPNSSDKLEENTAPMDTLRFGFSLMYCMTTSLASGGEGLGTLGLPESKLRELCQQAGFGSIRRVPLEDSIHALYEIAL